MNFRPALTFLLLCTLSLAFPHLLAAEEPAAEPPQPVAKLSEEERDMIAMLELLELFELLDNLDVVTAMEDQP